VLNKAFSCHEEVELFFFFGSIFSSQGEARCFTHHGKSD
jgi:hypothetical protein